MINPLHDHSKFIKEVFVLTLSFGILSVRVSHDYGYTLLQIVLKFGLDVLGTKAECNSLWDNHCMRNGFLNFLPFQNGGRLEVIFRSYSQTLQPILKKFGLFRYLYWPSEARPLSWLQRFSVQRQTPCVCYFPPVSNCGRFCVLFLQLRESSEFY